MWKKSALWGPMMALLMCLGVWAFFNTDHTLSWLATGLLFGMAVELGWSIAERRQMKQLSSTIAVGVALVLVWILIMAMNLKALYGFMAGMLFPMVITLVIYQKRKKRIITWDDIRSR